MRVVMQSGDIFRNAPKQVEKVDYAVVTTDSNSICCILKTMDAKNVMIMYPDDPNFDDAVRLLGLDKNETIPDLIKV